ncbi:hypothetical protein B0H17DRAFT_1158229 [Mycena rosella]|uniref:CxC2-like cysteine cluster KDZ transposase-associated domain-containing protein n=1 Tax=Mycena rosella TaxID=1033263 RepID=A0AAD7DTC3_MYCRO|nr:hypothetical protein B0H17DRAFT_1158229 [Mycena rosella]
MEFRDEFLDKMLRVEGRGDPIGYTKCAGCTEIAPTFCCAHQLCHGLQLFCKPCIVREHKVLPTHWIEEWQGESFECRSLQKLGYVIQLGHPPGYNFPTASNAHKDFCVIDLTGIHTVNVRFCECDARIKHRQQLMRVQWWLASVKKPQTCATFAVIRLFQIMNCLGKIAAHDFMRSLELLTNNNGLTPPRYKGFLFLAQDCNFRLINRDISTAAKDPIISDGLGYFVNNEKYAKYLRAHVSEEEISSCSEFQTMFLANRKRVKGLRTTGVGDVTCARHTVCIYSNMWRPNGIGDLQLGERYLLNAVIFYLILSYHIACQYGKNFWSWMVTLPTELHLVLDQSRVWFKVPNFHLPPHKPACHSPFSFHFMWGAGQTHRETVEQNWEFTNGAAASTKMMGVGARHATLEDLFGFHNWRRLVSWRGTFTKRMKENVTEGQVHQDAFDVFDVALQEQVPELVSKWKEWVTAWESKQHTTSTESPFEVKEKGMSMKDIHLKLAKEELLRSGEGIEVEREDTPSTFIMMGLDIEELQHYLAIDVKAISNPTPTQELDFMKCCGMIVKRIRVFRKLQHAYMPHVRQFLMQLQRVLWDMEADHKAEAIRLFMPSDIADASRRVKVCAVGLPAVEAELREGEAHEALETIRRGLRMRTMTNSFRLCNMTGQRALTRGQGKLRYRYARNAVSRLRGNGEWDDIRALNERALTDEELVQREAVHNLRDVEEGGIAAYGVMAQGESRRTLSWIWYTVKAGEPSEQELVEALRVEWCKVYARTQRWIEETVLVEEEMRRTIEYGVYEAGVWLERASARTGVSDELVEGLNAYAKEQADREARTCEKLRQSWAQVREDGCTFLGREAAASVHMVPREWNEHEEGGDDEGEDDEEERPDYEDEDNEDNLLE